MSATRAVTIILPTVRMHSAQALTEAYVRRVCGYARVSTDNDEQLNSYEAQMEYYTKFINQHEGWEFAGLYSDEGISGTSIKNRKGFQKMLSDAMDGKIDLIVTKSISRFARNTVDSISTVRMLKAKGVEVFFEKDGLWTFDPSAELTITILSSIAQEESRNLSQNVIWGKRAGFAEGKVSMPYKNFLGYDRGEDGQPVINEKQAELVRRIYSMFINGMTLNGIAKQLTKENIPTPGGKQKWQSAVVKSILSNEKYKGDALLQKKFCTDYLTKKMKVNEGEIPQYYVKGSHPPIVGAELFDHVQSELQRREETRYTAKAGCFAGRIICGDCGGVFGSKIWHSTSKYKRKVWRCNRKYEKEGDKCSTPHFYEKQLKNIFLGFVNSLIYDRDGIIASYKDVISTLTDNTILEEEHKTLQSECEIMLELMRKMTQDNARTAQDQTEFQKCYNAIAERYDIAKNRLDEIEKTINARKDKHRELERFVRLLKKKDDLMTEFDEELWFTIIHQMKVLSASEFTFVLKDGTEMQWSI